MFKVHITDNPPVYDPAIFDPHWENRLCGMQGALSDVKHRLKNARSINRRMRLGKQMNTLTARILALKLAHR